MKAVLFDMFGVIARVQSPESMSLLERTAGGDPDRFWVAYWSERPPTTAARSPDPATGRRCSRGSAARSTGG